MAIERIPESVRKEDNLQKEYDNLKQYLTANNINTIINVVNNNAQLLSSIISTDIPFISGEYQDLVSALESVSTSLSSLISSIVDTTNLNSINEKINTLSTNISNIFNGPSTVFKANKAISADHASSATSAERAQSAVSASVAQELNSLLRAKLISEIKQLLPANNGSGNGSSNPSITALSTLYIQESETSTISYDGSADVIISSILSSYNAANAKYALLAAKASVANSVVSSLILADINGNTISYNGATSADLSEGVYRAAVANSAQSAEVAKKLSGSLIFKGLDEETYTFDGSTDLDLLNSGICSSKYATSAINAATADLALSADSATNATTAKKVQNLLKIRTDENVYTDFDGSSETIINSVYRATVADSLATNKPLSTLTIKYLNADGTIIDKILYDGLNAKEIEISATPATAGSVQTNTSKLEFYVNQEAINGEDSSNSDAGKLYYPGTSGEKIVISSILLAISSNMALSASKATSAQFAIYDDQHNKISEKYAIRVEDPIENYPYYYGIPGNRLNDNRTEYVSGQCLNNYKYFKDIYFDKTYGLILSDNKVYPIGISSTTPYIYNGFNCDVNLNESKLITFSKNINEIYYYNKYCAAIDHSNKLYVWGKADNNWFGLLRPKRNILTAENDNIIQSDTRTLNTDINSPTIVSAVYDVSLENYNKCDVIFNLSLITNTSSDDPDATPPSSISVPFSTLISCSISSQINNTQQLTYTNLIGLTQLQPGIKKLIKGNTGCGAILLTTDNTIYGCGKNKNQLFGRLFKNNCVFDSWIKLPINHIIEQQYIYLTNWNGISFKSYDSILDIKSIHTDDGKDIFMIITTQGRIYINGDISNLSVIKMPLFVHNSNIYEFPLKNTDAANQDNSSMIGIRDNNIDKYVFHFDTTFTGNTETTLEKLNGWYIWRFAYPNDNIGNDTAGSTTTGNDTTGSTTDTKTVPDMSVLDCKIANISVNGIIGLNSASGLLFNGYNLIFHSSMKNKDNNNMPILPNLLVFPQFREVIETYQDNWSISSTTNISLTDNLDISKFDVKITKDSLFILYNEKVFYLSCASGFTDIDNKIIINSNRILTHNNGIMSYINIKLFQSNGSIVLSMTVNRDDDNTLLILQLDFLEYKDFYNGLYYDLVIYNNGYAGITFEAISSNVQYITTNGTRIYPDPKDPEAKSTNYALSTDTDLVTSKVLCSDGKIFYYLSQLTSNNICFSLTVSSWSNEQSFNESSARYDIKIYDTSVISSRSMLLIYNYQALPDTASTTISSSYKKKIKIENSAANIISACVTLCFSSDDIQPSSTGPYYYLNGIFGLSAIYYNTNLKQYEMFSYTSELHPIKKPEDDELYAYPSSYNFDYSVLSGEFKL